MPTSLAARAAAFCFATSAADTTVPLVLLPASSLSIRPLAVAAVASDSSAAASCAAPWSSMDPIPLAIFSAAPSPSPTSPAPLIIWSMMPAPLSSVSDPQSPATSESTAAAVWPMASGSCAELAAEDEITFMMSSRSFCSASRAASAAARSIASWVSFTGTVTLPATTGGGGGGAVACLLRVLASDAARPTAPDESPDAPLPVAAVRRLAALEASSTTAATVRF